MFLFWQREGEMGRGKKVRIGETTAIGLQSAVDDRVIMNKVTV